MGFFSFGNKDDAPRRRDANASSGRSARAGSSKGASSGTRVERRARRAEERTGDVDAMMLDPSLPEKQRARRRLVGAIALVIAVVVVLPMVLDSHPKPVTDDISIDIPNRAGQGPQVARDEDKQAGVVSDHPTADTAASRVAPSASVQANLSSSTSVQSGAQPAQRGMSAPVVQAPPKQPSKPPSRIAATTSAIAAPSPANADSGTPGAPVGARFAVQLGTFTDDANARAWVDKLKAVGVPVYTEHRKQADGSTRTLLRAGPFADRAAASAAIAKVREAGLTASAGSGQ